jgi:hypothetical protein
MKLWQDDFDYWRKYRKADEIVHKNQRGW